MCASSKITYSKIPKNKGLGNYFKLPLGLLHASKLPDISNANLTFKSRWVCFPQITHGDSLKDRFTTFMYKVAEFRLYRASYFLDSLPNLETFEVLVYCTLGHTQKKKQAKEYSEAKAISSSFRKLSWFTFRVTKRFRSSDEQNKLSFLHSSVQAVT